MLFSEIETPRSSTGNRLKGLLGLYLPNVFPAGNYVLPPYRASILDVKVGGRTLSASYSKVGRGVIRDRLAPRLQSEIGMKLAAAKVLLSRKYSTIRRIENFVHAVVDCFIFFDIRVFLIKSIKKAILRCIRKILSIGPYNLDLLISYWKEFTNWVTVHVCELVVEKPPTFTACNPFSFLTTVPPFSMKPGTRRDFSKYAIFTQSRHLPCGGKQASMKALIAYKENLTRPPSVSAHLLDELSNMAFRFGQQMSSFVDLDLAHISLNSAGDPDYPKKEGGRVRSVLESVRPMLNFIPTEDETISILGYNVFCLAGRRRWTFWFRRVPLWFNGEPDPELGTEYTSNIEGVDYKSAWGFDYALGQQIYLCALLVVRDLTENFSKQVSSGDFPCRVTLLPEPGGKVRSVTTSPWWNIIIQQGPAHVIRGVLRGDRECRDGLSRENQAYMFLDHMSTMGIEGLPKNYSVLSSDLSEATDRLGWDVLENMVMPFTSGLGIEDEGFLLAISLVLTPRKIFLPDNSTIISCSSVAMGEPMAKGFLCLYGKLVQKIALNRYVRGQYDLSIRSRVFDPVWKLDGIAFSIGGDDHIQVGPTELNNLLTSTHRAYGSSISASKHGVSRTAVKYCENFLVFKAVDLRINAKAHQENIEISPFLETLKMKLFSTSEVALATSEEKNVSIGKAIGLTNLLRWFPASLITQNERILIRDRFLQRMGEFLPHRIVGSPPRVNPLFAQLLLPRFLGGLGLATSIEEEEYAIRYAPLPTIEFLHDLCRFKEDPGTFDDESRMRLLSMGRVLSSFTSNSFVRGVDVFRSLKVERSTIFNGRLILSSEVSTNFPDKASLKRAEKTGLIEVGSLVRERTRLEIFFSLLSGKKPETFCTLPWRQRYARIWAAMPPHCGEEMRTFVRSIVKYPLQQYDTKFFLYGHTPVHDSFEGPYILPYPSNEYTGYHFERQPSYKDILEFYMPNLIIRLGNSLFYPSSVDDGGTRCPECWGGLLIFLAPLEYVRCGCSAQSQGEESDEHDTIISEDDED